MFKGIVSSSLCVMLILGDVASSCCAPILFFDCCLEVKTRFDGSKYYVVITDRYMYIYRL